MASNELDKALAQYEERQAATAKEATATAQALEITRREFLAYRDSTVKPELSKLRDKLVASGHEAGVVWNEPEAGLRILFVGLEFKLKGSGKKNSVLFVSRPELTLLTIVDKPDDVRLDTYPGVSFDWASQSPEDVAAEFITLVLRDKLLL